MIDIKETIRRIADRGRLCDMEKIGNLLERAVETSIERWDIEVELYAIENGWHFNKELLRIALSHIGGVRKTCDEIEKMMNSYGISMPSEITIEDISYALHMFYSDYSPLNLPDSTAVKWAILYCTDEDYPCRNEKCFTEWFYKMKLIKEK